MGHSKIAFVLVLVLSLGLSTNSGVSAQVQQTEESQLKVCKRLVEQSATGQAVIACLPLVWSANPKIRNQSSGLLEVAVDEVNRRLATNRSVVPIVPDPYIVRGGCPFEGCTFGMWSAMSIRPIYEKPGNRDAVGQLVRGERVAALLGELRVHPVKGKVVGKIDQLRLGEPVYLLDYMGEGQSNIWVRGRVVVDPRWGGTCRPAPACESAIRFPVENAPHDWWVKIQRRNGQTGWVHADSVSFSGTDQFGGEDAVIPDPFDKVVPTPSTQKRGVVKFSLGTGNNSDNCVFFARDRVPTLPTGLDTWQGKLNAINSGSPQEGSVAMIGFSTGAYRDIGHAAVVESISGNSITIIEANYTPGQITRRTATGVDLADAARQLGIAGFYRP